MLSRRSLLGRLASLLGIAAVGRHVVAESRDGFVYDSGWVTESAGRVSLASVFDPRHTAYLPANDNRYRITYTPAETSRTLEWVDRMRRARHPIVLAQDEQHIERWDEARGAWVPIEDALAAWNGAREAGA